MAISNILRAFLPLQFRRKNPGHEAERLAANWLQRQGLRILARNYRCRPGEIDLVANHDDTLVFIEVRLRRNTEFGGAAASITKAKQMRIKKAAQHYLTRHGRGLHLSCRFDCLLLDEIDAESMTYQWVRNAFF